tara:strand:+ start:294 stop:929 length:636 start_codon:yes stop_codon:yes gene_type:complete
MEECVDIEKIYKEYGSEDVCDCPDKELNDCVTNNNCKPDEVIIMHLLLQLLASVYICGCYVAEIERIVIGVPYYIAFILSSLYLLSITSVENSNSDLSNLGSFGAICILIASHASENYNTYNSDILNVCIFFAFSTMLFHTQRFYLPLFLGMIYLFFAMQFDCVMYGFSALFFASFVEQHLVFLLIRQFSYTMFFAFYLKENLLFVKIKLT